jgi:hypothetical protein
MSDITKTEIVPLSSQRQMIVERLADADIVRIVNADGLACLTVRLTPEGPVLQFDGSLMLQTSGDLAVSAERLALHGREGVAITSNGDVTLETTGDLSTKARIQNITATRGNVNVKANDDVRVDGERIFMNCVDT